MVQAVLAENYPIDTFGCGQCGGEKMISQDQKNAQQKILTMQRDLMNEIMDYQIAYGEPDRLDGM